MRVVPRTADARMLCREMTRALAYGFSALAVSGALLAASCSSDGDGRNTNASAGQGGSGATAGSGATGGSAGAGGSGGSTAVPEGKFRILILADTHIIGPQYDGDEDKIYTTEENARLVAQTVNDIQPQPDFGVLLGDVFHDGYHKPDGEEASVEWYKNNTTAVSISAEVLSTFDTTVYPVWGNHDYELDDEYGTDFAHQLFEEFFDHKPYYSLDHEGWKFILANGQLGSKGNGSYGAAQLAWIDEQLAEGKPTMLFTHYMLMDNQIETVTHHDEEPDGPIKDLYQLVEKYKTDNLKSIFCGHTHRFWDVTGVTGLDVGAPESFKHYVVGATRFGTNNFWIVEFDSEGGSYEILDEAKAPMDVIPKTEGTACDYSQPPPYPCGN